MKKDHNTGAIHWLCPSYLNLLDTILGVKIFFLAEFPFIAQAAYKVSKRINLTWVILGIDRSDGSMDPDPGRRYELTILAWINLVTAEMGTVKAGNVVTFFAQNNFFFIILCRWPNVICCYKIWLQNVSDVGKAIFGFCQHLGPFFKKMLGWRHYPPVG